MAYLNLNLIHDKQYTLPEVYCMQILKQARSEDMEQYLAMYLDDLILEKFAEEKIIDAVKKKKKTSSDFSTYRLSKKGNELLELFETPEINSDDIKIYDWLSGIYQSTEREIGNKKRTKIWIACFRAHSGIQRNSLAFLCQHFINDESQMAWSQKLEFLFFKPSNLFTTKFELEQSRLYQHYIKHQAFFDKKFAELEKN
jgi:hypothetical protein